MMHNDTIVYGLIHQDKQMVAIIKLLPKTIPTQ